MNQESQITGSSKGLRNLAIFLVTALVPVVIIVSQVVGVFYKSSNPDNVDVTNGLAYLQQTLIAGIGSGVLIALVVIWLIIRMYHSDKTFSQAKLPMILLIFISLSVVTMLALNNYASAVEDDYLREHGRPTISEFFDKIEEQKDK